jgi:hypothetical protein
LNLIRKLLNSISRWLALFLAGASSVLKTRAALQLENVSLRHQISVLQRSAKKRPQLHVADRLLWVWLSRVWAQWRSSLIIVKPETVIAWHRNAFSPLLDVEDSARQAGPSGRPARCAIGIASSGMTSSSR